VGTKFPHRAPEGQVLLRCFLGGTADPGVLNESDDAVTEAVLDELHRIVGFSARPAFAHIFRWPRSMAQYAVGHQQRMAEVKERLAAVPGMYLAGNAYEGIGIPDCIRTGKQAAERILAGSL
jgi:oxygen-dependent protoporphyrinogen oxidase